MAYAFRAPRWLPELVDVMHELGVDARAVARHLGVAERTVYHWLACGRAPRAAVLALWLESPAGRELVACEAENAARVHRAHAQSLERENAMLRARIARLEAIADFGSANDPVKSPGRSPLATGPASIGAGLETAR